jgi:hypothetical protein
VGQRRLSDLSGANQGNGGLPGKGSLDGRECAAGNHPSILSTSWTICKDNRVAVSRRTH